MILTMIGESIEQGELTDHALPFLLTHAVPPLSVGGLPTSRPSDLALRETLRKKGATLSRDQLAAATQRRDDPRPLGWLQDHFDLPRALR